VTQFAALHDADLRDWIAGEVAFPSTMVDRIVPATTDDDRARVAAALAVEDAWPVVTEPFRQWVVEDHFPLGRPRLEDSGATLVENVAPFELAKLRLLNGAHSALAYLGYLAGYQTLAEVTANPAFARFARGLMDEAGPTLRGLGDLGPYKAQLLERFHNPGLRHRTWQIAMDGSQKLPQRLLGTIHDRLASGAPIPRLALAVAAWMRYVTGVDEQGRPIDVRDPLKAKFAAIAEAAGADATRLADGLLGLRQVFPVGLAADARFRDAVVEALTSLMQEGARATVEGFEGWVAGLR